MMPELPADVARDGVLHNWTSYSGTLTNVVVEHRVGPATARLATTGLPVRLLHGDRDREAPLAIVRELAERFAWPLKVCGGRTHLLPLEEPDACAAVLRDLLREAEPPPPGSSDSSPHALGEAFSWKPKGRRVLSSSWYA
jgi:pimeloyl-ACP methyl ester carboxylesterase